jgi:signal transduction histidine kinase
MFRSRRGKIVLASQATEREFLAFLDGVAEGDLRAGTLTKVLTEYCERFVVPTLDDSMEWAFAFWDPIAVEQTLRLVSHRGLPRIPDDYPRLVHYGDGIIGSLAEAKRTRRTPLLVPDLQGYERNGSDVIASQLLGFRGLIALPIHQSKELIGVMSILFKKPLEHASGDKRDELQTEAARIAFAIRSAVTRSTALFREALALEFSDVAIDVMPADAQLALNDLQERVRNCLHLTVVVLGAVSASVSLRDAEDQFASFERYALRRPDIVPQNQMLYPLTEVRDREDEQIGELCISQKSDSTYFSRIDLGMVQDAATTISRYLSKYLTIHAVANAYQERLKRQRELLALSDAAIAEFMVAPGIDDVAEALVRRVASEFNVRAALYLSYNKSKRMLSPVASSPSNLAESLRTRRVNLSVRDKCVLAAKSDWHINDCATCRECKGVTTVAALRQQAIDVGSRERAIIGDLFIDFGIEFDIETLLPISAGQRMFGVLDVYTGGDKQLSQEERYFLTVVTNGAAQAVYIKTLHSELDDAYRSSTRGDVARDVVHTLAPTVASLDTALDLLHRALRPLHGDLRDKARVRNSVREAIDELDFVTDVVRHQHNVVARYDLTARERRTGKTEDVLLSNTINDVVALNTLRAHEKRIRIRRHAVGKERALSASRGDLFLIMWNLIHNAIKFTRGDKDSELHIDEVYDEDSVCVTVKDQGVGIRPSDIQRMWDLGVSTRAPNATESTSGLGLYIVRELAKTIAGARVDARSIFGRGSEFILRIEQGEQKK